MHVALQIYLYALIQVTVSFDLRFQIGKIIDEFKPDLIHVNRNSLFTNRIE